MSEERYESITVWRQGRFQTERKPDWWEAELERLWPAGREGADVNTQKTGEVDFWMVQGFELAESYGWAVCFEDGTIIHTVWAPTLADYLDLMTSRATAWTNLSVMRSPAENIEQIRNVLIAFARHGHGKHVSEDDGTSKTDLDEKIRQERIRREAERNRKAPPTKGGA